MSIESRIRAFSARILHTGRRSLRVVLLFLVLVSSLAAAEDDRESVVNLDQIVVTGTKTEHSIKDVPVTTLLVTRKDIEALNAENVMDVLATLPGITTANHEDVFGTYAGFSTDKGTFAYAVKTDKKGMARIKLLTSGIWLFMASHEEPFADTSECDLEKYTASLTFEIK